MKGSSLKRVLVTGATGFIGQHSLEYLAVLGFEIHALSRNVGTIPPQKVNVHWHEVDIFNNKQLDSIIAEVKPTYLLHFAWYAEPGKYWTAPENFECVKASLDLLKSFSFYGGKRVVMAGTCAEYDWSYGRCSEYSTPRVPSTVYGVCKNSLQEMLMSYSREYGLSAAWGRIFLLYGDREHPSRLVSSVIRSILKGEFASCTSGEQIRDFLYVGDVASAFVSLLDSEIQGPINIASGEAVSIKEVVEKVAVKLGRPELLNLGAYPISQNDPPLLLADIRRLKEELAWQPSFDIDEGLDAAIEWWRCQ